MSHFLFHYFFGQCQLKPGSPTPQIALDSQNPGTPHLDVIRERNDGEEQDQKNAKDETYMHRDSIPW